MTSPLNENSLESRKRSRCFAPQYHSRVHYNLWESQEDQFWAGKKRNCCKNDIQQFRYYKLISVQSCTATRKSCCRQHDFLVADICSNRCYNCSIGNSLQAVGLKYCNRCCNRLHNSDLTRLQRLAAVHVNSEPHDSLETLRILHNVLVDWRWTTVQ